MKKKIIWGKIRFVIFLFLLIKTILLASGAFDHGTATGKGKLQIDCEEEIFMTGSVSGVKKINLDI